MAVALETVVKQLTDSGIIAPGKLENFVPPKADPKDGEELLRELYKQGLLTKFQAQQFAQNRARSLILGNYTLIDKIGAGGMGQVFKAEHRRLKRVVAIKMLPKAMLQDAAAVARFQREVEAAARLRHSNVVATDDADEAGGVHFLVMEYVEGQDLSALVKKDGPLPVNKAINYILQTARGLEFAHGEGVVHRDIKPANLLLDKKGVVKILDMGLARISGDGNAGAQAELTGTGAVMGTIDYMAPEQGLSTKHADARADIYSLGCSLHYLLIAKPTFDGETITAKLLAHHNTPPPNLCDLRSDVPTQLQAIFAKMVAKKLEDRYQSMTGVIADLESCQAGLSGKALAAGESGVGLASATVKTSSSPDTHTSEMTSAFGDRLMQAIPQPEKYVEPESKGPPWKNTRLLIGAGAAGFLFLLLGVWVIIRDKDGKEVTRVEVPEGASVTVQTQPPPKDAATPETTVPATPAVATTQPAVRWPLAPSKPEDINRLLDAQAEVMLRTGAVKDTNLKAGDALPAGPATVVGVKLAGGLTDDALLGFVAGFTDLEDLIFGKGANPFTTQGLLKLKSLVELRRLTLYDVGDRAAGATDLLKSLPHLEFLRLPHGTKVAEEWAVAAIARPSITEVSAYRAAFTDAGLARLEKMSQLRKLILSDNGLITEGAIERLAAALPNCRIEYNTGNAAKIIEPRTPPVNQPASLAPGVTGPAITPPLAKAPFDAAGAKAHQAAWARYLGTTVESKNSVGMSMGLIPPGEFLMGSTDEQVEAAKKMAEDDKVPTDGNWKMLLEEVPQHKVTISRPFLIGSTEVTVAQFRKFVEASKYVTEAEKYGFGNSNFKAIEKTNEDNKGKNWKNPGYPIIDDAPVTQVTWNDAAAYCAWLSEQEQRRPWYRPDGSGDWLVAAPADGYRLPTEAEWEYACRAGTTTQYSFGDDRAQLGQYGWFLKNSGNRVNPVALKLPNPFGLFDMHGNAAEWCQDCYDAKWYEKQSSLSAVPSDPSGPSSSYGRVLRGGVYYNFAYQCRSATRSGNAPWYRISTNGFRIVREFDAVPAGSAVTGPASLPASIQAAGANSGDVDRAVAEWVISGGGEVDVFKGPAHVKKLSDLPPQPFLLNALALGNNQQLTPADARRLAALPRLEMVQVYNIEISPQTVAELRACARLRTILFTRIKFQPGALEALLTLKRLVHVGFIICNIPDAFAARLGELPNLRAIRFYDDRTVTDEGLIGLAKSPPPNLASLVLTGTDAKRVTAAGLSAIATLPHLEKLFLDLRKTDDQALRALAAAKGLSEIGLYETPVTRAGADWLHETLGNCQVLVSTAEQAGKLNGPAYQATVRKLVTRGFVFQAHVGNHTTVYLKSDAPWPDGSPIAVKRAILPETSTLDDLRDLAQLLDLQVVSGYTGKPPGSLRELLPLKNLTELSTGDVPLTSDEVQLLFSFPKLRSVGGCVDGDASIAAIAKLPHLTKLTISAESKITDACLNSLAGVAMLNALTLHPTSTITRPAVEAFAAARPDVTVKWNDIVIEPPAASGPGAAGAASAPPLAKAPFDAAGAKAHQAAWAKYLGTTVESKNSVGMSLVLIPPGEFLMGSTDEQVAAALKVAEEMKASEYDKVQIQASERPQHRVVITKPFLMGSTEVTIGQFKTFAAASGYLTEAEQAAAKDPKNQTYLNPGYPVTDDLPAACISWNDAAAYGKWLSEQEKSTYRLPTEAEWEYACRAGTTTQYSFGDDRKQLSQFGWHDKNADKAKPVGTKLPNGFGLHDMHGNLWEWCQDIWDDKWYEKSPINDPHGPAAGSTRVLRGGRWYGSTSNCRSAYRNHLAPSYYLSFSPGFRIVRVVDGTADSRFATGTVSNQPNKPWNTPAFLAWMKEVQAMPAAEQIKAVSKKLVELNPGFDGKVTPTIEKDVVTELGFASDKVTDITPVRALAGLKRLSCGSSPGEGALSDLTPLKGMALASLGFAWTQVSDLAPLSGMTLTNLNCGGTKVHDLSPLRGMPLTQFACDRTQISDLSPLQGMPLTNLSFEHIPISDLSPLRGMQLTNLNCYGTPVSDLSVLRGMPLKTLTLQATKISDLSPLEQCRSLNTLLIVKTKVTAAGVAALQKALPNCKIDWDGAGKATTTQPNQPWNTPAFQAWVKEVQAMPAGKKIEAVSKKLVELNPGFDGKLGLAWNLGKGITGAPKIENGVVTEFGFLTDKVADISPVRALSALKVLICNGGDFQGILTDISPLEGMGLTALAVPKNKKLSDLSPLKDMPLAELNLWSTSVSDFSALKGMPLTKLNLRGIRELKDLTPLQGMPLTVLDCVDARQLTDLSPLHGMKLTSLKIAKTKIANLSPLRGAPLDFLEANVTPIADLSPLGAMPLTHLEVSECPNISDLSPLDACKNLQVLQVKATKVTAAAVATLQKALPTCTINWDGATSASPTGAGAKPKAP